MPSSDQLRETLLRERGSQRSPTSASTASAERHPAEDPWPDPVPLRSAPPPPTFPVEALPDWLRDFVTAEAHATQTPEELAGLLALATLAAAVQERVDVEIRPGWCEGTNLYVVVAMESGSRKSAVFGDMTRPTMQVETALQNETRPAIGAALEKRKALEQAAERARREAAKEEDPNAVERGGEEAARYTRRSEEVDVPALPRITADDATPEATVSLLAEQGSIAVLSSEGGVFDLMAGRYSEGKLPNLDAFLKGHAGDSIRVDRKGRPPEHVPRPRLTLGLTVQPKVLRQIQDRPGFRGRGLLARFLYALPASMVGRRESNPDPVPEQVRETYTQRVEALARSLEEGLTLVFSREADEAMQEFQDAIEPQLGPGGDLHHMADWGSKLAGATARIAALLHVAERFTTGVTRPISAEIFSQARKIAEFLIAHALAVFEMMADADNETLAAAEKVLRWIKGKQLTEFSHQECWQAVKGGRIKNIDDLDPVLELLKDLSYIRPREAPPSRPSRPGRPPRPTYEVNPQVATPITPEIPVSGPQPAGSRGNRGTSQGGGEDRDATDDRTTDPGVSL